MADALDSERRERLAAFDHCEALAANALDVERCERVEALEQCEALSSELSSTLDDERSQRLAAIERLSQEVHRSTLAQEEFRLRIADVCDKCTQEAEDRVALELAVHKTVEVMHEDFDLEGMKQANLTKELARSLEKEMKDRCAEQEKLAERLLP